MNTEYRYNKTDLDANGLDIDGFDADGYRPDWWGRNLDLDD